jgi:hypothetical protein
MKKEECSVGEYFLMEEEFSEYFLRFLVEKKDYSQGMGK